MIRTGDDKSPLKRFRHSSVMILLFFLLCDEHKAQVLTRPGCSLDANVPSAVTGPLDYLSTDSQILWQAWTQQDYACDIWWHFTTKLVRHFWWFVLPFPSQQEWMHYGVPAIMWKCLRGVGCAWVLGADHGLGFWAYTCQDTVAWQADCYTISVGITVKCVFFSAI